jgi:hypothetical protein
MVDNDSPVALAALAALCYAAVVLALCSAGSALFFVLNRVYLAVTLSPSLYMSPSLYYRF